MKDVAVVVIGRNEGDRLICCLDSLLAQLSNHEQIVYVDSGSTDQSCEVARKRGISVVELDLSIPFTAARARNAGLEWLYTHFSALKYVQFIDGDCELVKDWLDIAVVTLEQNEQLAVVCGRRRERYPDASPYNRLADMEWDTPLGEARACGGDALIRIESLRDVEGYNSCLICGEEPEMCIRMRRKGWLIQRIDAEMTLHDADMHRMSQWWQRSIRGGWAVAEGFAMYGNAAERYMKKEHWSGWWWGAMIPGCMLALLWLTQGLSLLGIGLYGLLGWRIYRYRTQRGDGVAHAFLYAVFCTLSKFPQMIGQLSYWLKRSRGKTATLIEYKKPVTRGA